MSMLWKENAVTVPEYVPEYVFSYCLKATEEFVILGWSVLIKVWLQTFPVKNYKDEHQFRLIINH